jgi:dCMP deaminase
MPDFRPTRDLTFMNIAREFARRGTCNRAQVGAIIVKNSHIISHGYNGAPTGQPQCNEVGCDVLSVERLPPAEMEADTSEDMERELTMKNWRFAVSEELMGGVRLVQISPPEHERILELGCQRAIHAEANAIAYAARVGVNCSEGTMYSTHEPCQKCAELILTAGIIEVLYAEPYRLGAAAFLRDAGIHCEDF